MTDIRVLIADDEPLMSQALRIYCETAPGFACVGEVRNGRLAVGHAAALRPDVVLMDLQMPVMDGIEATRLITSAHPEVRVVAVTSFSSEEYLIPALHAGASGYLVKDAEPGDILAAIRAVHHGEAALSPAVSRELLRSIRVGDHAGPAAAAAGAPALSPRELDVLRALARGRNNAEIGADLYISEATVKATLGRLTAKLEVRDRVQALIRASQLGLVELTLD